VALSMQHFCVVQLWTWLYAVHSGMCNSLTLADSLTFKRRMSVICDGTPTPLPPNDRYMRRAAAVTSIGPDRFMRSNKTIATDQDPCQ